MNFLEKIAGNKTVLNLALSKIGESLKKDGVTCIVIRQGGDDNADTPGIDIKMYKEAVGILTGAELNAYILHLRAMDNVHKSDIAEGVTDMPLSDLESGGEAADHV